MNKERNICPSLNGLLERFAEFYTTTSEIHKAWRTFYEVVSAAYQLPQNKRPSISEISIFLKERGVNNHGNIAVIYAHCLYSIATYEGKEIYKEGFNP